MFKSFFASNFKLPIATKLLAAAFGADMKNWQTTPQMLADRATLSTDSKAVFNALSKRIHMENTELYTLVDKLDA